MPEIALAMPFDASEIKSIIVEELRKRLDQLSPLQLQKEYAEFDVDYQVRIRLRRAGDTTPAKETMAWGKTTHKSTKILPVHGDVIETPAIIEDHFHSQEPNVEREQRNMAMTVEAGDGRGGRVTKKVHLRG